MDAHPLSLPMRLLVPLAAFLLIMALTMAAPVGALETTAKDSSFTFLAMSGQNSQSLELRRFLDGDATTATAGWVSGDRCAYRGAYAFLENDGILVARVTFAKVNYVQINDKSMPEGIRFYDGRLDEPDTAKELHDCPAAESAYPAHRGAFPPAPVVTIYTLGSFVAPTETLDTFNIDSPGGRPPGTVPTALQYRWDWVPTTAHTLALVAYQETLGEGVQIPIFAVYFDSLYSSVAIKSNKPTETPPPAPVGGGLFAVECPLDHTASDDPIVYPGQPGAAHLHQFFGAKGIDAFSVAGGLPSSPTTCKHLSDSAGYWTPALVSGTTNVFVKPEDFTAYYLAPEGHQVATIPAGLVMIADASAAPAVSGWSCFNNITQTFPTPQSCSATQTLGFLRETVHFPSCWDGVNLDSANHRSHMSYVCDAAHPIEIAHLVIQVGYSVFGAGNGSYHLAPNPDGTIPGVHADFMNGWAPQVLSNIVRDCLNAGLDCQLDTAVGTA